MNILGSLLKTIILKIAAAPLFFCLALTSASADLELVFGAYTADKPTAVVKQFQPFLNLLTDELSKEMGEPVKIKMKIARSYDEGIEDLVQGRVDFSRFGPASYITAKDAENGVGIIAMETDDGNKVFTGVIAVHADSKFTEVAELKGHSFAFGDSLSTIGRFLAQEILLNEGIKAADLSKYEYLGRHDAVGAAVGAGTFDAGALKSSTFNKLVAKGVPIRILKEFDNVTKPWIHRAGFDPATVAAMEKVFLNMVDSEVRNSITDSGFVQGIDGDYATIRSEMHNSAMFGG